MAVRVHDLVLEQVHFIQEQNLHKVNKECTIGYNTQVLGNGHHHPVLKWFDIKERGRRRERERERERRRCKSSTF